MVPIVTFIGWNATSKNALATQVITNLREFGYKLALIKPCEEAGIVHSMLLPDPDTLQLSGDNSILLITTDQMVLLAKNSKQSLTTVVHRYFPDVDIVIGEGFQDARGVYKIEVVNDPNQRMRDRVRGVVAVATDLDIAGDHVFGLNDSKEIASFIQKKFLNGKEGSKCNLLLLVNGNKIPLKGFIQDALSGTVAGFVNSLKFCDNISDIELRVKLDSLPAIPLLNQNEIAKACERQRDNI